MHGSNATADDPMLWYQGAGLNNRHWLHTDHEGSIVAITGASGANPTINSYDEYGIPGSGNSGRFQYTGQAWLSEVGMYYYKARIYSPTLGRFLQTDPIGYDGGVNLYEYAGDDPLDEDDPTGLLEQDEKPQDRSCQTGAPNGACSPFRTSYPGGAPNSHSSRENEAASRPQWRPDPGRVEDDEIDDVIIMGVGGLAAVGEAGIAEGTSAARVFWTGGELAKRQAAAVASSTGGKTLEQTVLGRTAEAVHRVVARVAGSGRAYRVMQPVWRALSANFARGAESAKVVIRGTPAASSIWKTVEEPILRAKSVIIEVIEK